MSLALKESSAIRHFEGNDVIEIRDGITFDFYMGLPHMCNGCMSIVVVFNDKGAILKFI